MMNKDIQSYKVAGRDVLHEKPDPLFNDRLDRRYSRVLKAVFRACFLVTAVILFVTLWKTFTGNHANRDGGNQPSPPINPENESTESEIVLETSEQTGTEYESRSKESTETESEDDESESEKKGNNEESIESVDISALEMGEAYIVNETDKNIDVEKMLEKGVSYRFPDDRTTPLVLILHTHTSEAYVGFDEETRGLKTVVSAGDALCTRLNALGVPSVHCTVIHDGDEKAGAYSNARETLETMLEIYPSIRCVIDVHRMSITDDKGNPLKTLASTTDPVAQIRMTVSAYESLKREWSDSLSLALALRKELNIDGEGICAPVRLSENRYNSDMCALYIIAEVGSEGNSTQEAIKAGERLAAAIAEAIFPQKK